MGENGREIKELEIVASESANSTSNFPIEGMRCCGRLLSRQGTQEDTGSTRSLTGALSGRNRGRACNAEPESTLKVLRKILPLGTEGCSGDTYGARS